MTFPNLDPWICSPFGSYLTILQLRISWFLCVLLQHCAWRLSASPPSLLRTLCCSRSPKTGLLWAREEVFALWITIWLATVSTFSLVNLRAAYCRNLTALLPPAEPHPFPVAAPAAAPRGPFPTTVQPFSHHRLKFNPPPPRSVAPASSLPPPQTNAAGDQFVFTESGRGGVSSHAFNTAAWCFMHWWKLEISWFLSPLAQTPNFFWACTGLCSKFIVGCVIIYLRVLISVAMRSLFVFPLDGESGMFFFFYYYFFFHFEPVLPAFVSRTRHVASSGNVLLMMCYFLMVIDSEEWT